MQKILFSLLLIMSGLMVGCYCQQYIRRRYQRHDLLLPRLRKLLQKISMLGIMPIAFVGATWIIPFDDLRVALIPLVGAVILLTGGLLGLLAALILKKQGKQKSVLFCCGFFTNVGSCGGLVSFIFFGEKGFALVSLYRLFEELLYYSLGFPVARYLGQKKGNLKVGSRLVGLFKDPFFLVAVGSLSLGFFLNFSGVERPLFYEVLNSFFVPVGTFILLVSIGLGMRFSNVREHLGEGVAISAIKFIILPFIAGGIGYWLGLSGLQDGLVLKVVILCAAMPVAFNALLAASIYDLDLDLANSCWLISTSCLVAVLPVLSYLFTLF